MKVKDYVDTLKKSKIFGEDIKEIEGMLVGKENEEIQVTALEGLKFTEEVKERC